MHPIPVWLTGDIHDADFARAVGWLRAVAACVEVSADSLPAAVAASPAAIVHFQARPGAISQAVIETLHRRAPLARLISVVGPWCEGELRSGRPPHGIARVLWHQWSARLPIELGLDSFELARAGYRPRTLTQVDRLLCTIPRLAGVIRGRGVAAICSASRSSFGALADACSIAGLQSRWQPPEYPPRIDDADLALIDGRELLTLFPESRSRSRPAIWLIDWPRPDDLAQASQCGINHVLARPFLLTDFVALVDAVLPQPLIDGQANSAA